MSHRQQPRLPWRAAVLRLPRAHALFGSVLLVATIVRVVAMLGYPPAFWITDSRRYVSIATQLKPDVIRPVGYSFMLWLLEPFHSALLVVGIQHAMGLAVGIAVYVLLRQRFGLPAWAATLAAVPPLLSVEAIQIEHFLLADTLFGLLITTAVVLMLWTPLPRVRTCAAVGLLLGMAAVVRSQGTLLAIPFAVYLVAQMAGRRTRPADMTRRFVTRTAFASLVAMGATLAAPVLAYASWFDSVHGTFQLTTSTGVFLYGRVSTFAECSVIKPPADERWLCVSVPVSERPRPGYYMWAPSSPLWTGEPYQPFSITGDRLETDFALRAIKAQPLDYLRTVWHSTVQGFTPHPGVSESHYVFPMTAPPKTDTSQYDTWMDVYEHGDPNTRLVQPYAGWMQAYQRFIVLPGPLLGAIVLAGLAGMALAWRRLGGPTLLPWLTGVTLVVTPAATTNFDARFVVASVPAFCIAAAIGPRQWTPAATRPESGGNTRRSGRLPRWSAVSANATPPTMTREDDEHDQTSTYEPL